jgi:predicted unusual protein kinase regulating ubiquinone biosynthesis (AarF/ABC1/UbiB family)
MRTTRTLLSSRPMAKGKERVPGRLTRSLKTAWLGGRVSSSYLGGRLADAFRGAAGRAERARERHEANAKAIVRTLSAIRGPMMKVGQILSTHAEALPGEYGDILKSLQQSAPPMSFETIERVLEKDLGDRPSALFADFEEDAVAAASLGQVHRAVLPDGTPVAVKVQYPGAVGSVEADLRNIQSATAMVKTVFADALGQERWDMSPVAEELAEHLMQETDYCREAYNAQLVGRLFEGDPEIVVPKVHLSHSGLRVITYDWLEGDDLDAGLLADDPELRKRTVRQLLHVLWHQIFRGGLMHADPHPGNFKVLPDGRLGILDYGCVKVFDEPFLHAFGSMVRSSLEHDREGLRRAFDDLGLLDDPNSAEEFEDMEKLGTFFSVGIHEDAPFDFAEFDYVATSKGVVEHFLSRGRPPPSQRNFIFLTRVLLGYYEYFGRAAQPINLHRMITRYAAKGFEGRVVDIPPYG